MLKKIKGIIRQSLYRKEFYQYSPYNIVIYRQLIETLLKRNYNFILLENYKDRKSEKKTNVILRHDIDTLECVNNFHYFLDEEIKLGVRSSCYLMADNKPYLLRDYRDAINKYRDKGFPFGLHTACYTEDDYPRAFRRETTAFYEETGFKPDSFTVHGHGELYKENRARFYKDVKRIMQNNNYKTTNIGFQYSYKITDASMDSRTHNRFIYTDFKKPPHILFSRAKVILVLTHPCYWYCADFKDTDGLV